MKRAMYKLLLLFSEKHLVEGVQLFIQLSINRENRKLILEKLASSLELIKKYMPVYFDQMIRDISGILVLGNHTFKAQYIIQFKLIDIYDEYILDREKLTEELASTIVHEAQHARLFRLGFGYKEHERERIEKVCRVAERKFGKRIPNGGRVIENANSWLESDLSNSLTNEAWLDNQFQALSDLNAPQWIIKLLRWKLNGNRT